MTARHLRLGTWTACGLRGVAHRPISTTTDRDRVTCRTCRAWANRHLAEMLEAARKVVS